MKFSLVCPPDGLDSHYGKKCFVKYDGIDCFDKKFKQIGQDQKMSFELYKILKSCPSLSTEFQEMTVD
jgi:hypothetical protein